MVEQNIFTLQISVNDASRVHVRETLAYLRKIKLQKRNGASSPCNLVEQIPFSREIVHQIYFLVISEGVVQAKHIRVSQPIHCMLLHENVLVLALLGDLHLIYNLHGANLSGRFQLTAADAGERALSNPLEDLVVATSLFPRLEILRLQRQEWTIIQEHPPTSFLTLLLGLGDHNPSFTVEILLAESLQHNAGSDLNSLGDGVGTNATVPGLLAGLTGIITTARVR
mmetsp:Transcript_34058/g.88971  ORF Transcript_34058/g.88971 Transcript_34058/m.88971 type:complete len:226 (+) Transcript_34058:798-1475(+)